MWTVVDGGLEHPAEGAEKEPVVEDLPPAWEQESEAKGGPTGQNWMKQ